MVGERVFMLAGVALYAAAVIWTEVVAARGRRVGWTCRALVAAGLMMHTAALLMRVVRVGRVPIAYLPEICSTAAWLTASAYLALEWTGRWVSLGALVLPVAMALAAVAAADAGRGIQDTRARSVLLAVHAGAALAGVVLFALAAALSAMFLYQDRALKKHRLVRMMPPVRQLEQTAYTTVGLGFICLTISLALGVYLASRMGRNWLTQPSVAFSALLWAVFAVLFHVRLARAWLGRKVAYFTLAGFAVTVALVVVMLGGDRLHWFLK